jgi:hypothetical protein
LAEGNNGLISDYETVAINRITKKTPATSLSKGSRIAFKAVMTDSCRSVLFVAATAPDDGDLSGLLPEMFQRCKILGEEI